MACFRPLDAWQLESGSIVFSERGKVRRALTLPCGQCVGCRMERARQWTVRCIHEAALHDASSFVTLTYDEAHCPTSLRHSDFQKFMKRVRKKFGPTRFFMCGEYGEHFGRPHFHACLFGVHFDDRYAWSHSGDGAVLYRSPSLERLWPSGFSTVGDVTEESAGYCARYVLKKVVGQRADEHYERCDIRTGELVQVVPEYCRMSLKPALGVPWLEKFHGDVYGDDRDQVPRFDRKVKAPRAYDRWLSRRDDDLSEHVKLRRYERRPEDDPDGTRERLAVREKVAQARVDLGKRRLETS